MILWGEQLDFRLPPPPVEEDEDSLGSTELDKYVSPEEDINNRILNRKRKKKSPNQGTIIAYSPPPYTSTAQFFNAGYKKADGDEDSPMKDSKTCRLL